MMNNELKPYEEYKKTGLFWINEIPVDWEWQFLSQACKEKCQKNSMCTKNNVLSLSYGQIIRKKNKDFGLVPKEYGNYQIVKQGDIILRLTDLQNDKRSLRTGLVKETGIITSAYTCLYTKNNSSSYIHYLLHAYDLKKVFYGMGGGVRQSIGYEDIRKLKLPIPPRPEQDQIAKYLDYKLAKINKFIKAEKRKLELVRELIDGELERILKFDDISCCRLKNIADSVGKEVKRVSEKEYIPIGLYNRGRGIFHKPSTLGADLGDSIFFEVGDDYLVFSGQFAWEGAVAVTNSEDIGCIASHRYPMIKGKANVVTSKFLWAFFVSKYGNHLLNLYSRGAAGRNRPLNIDHLLKEKIPVPLIENQARITRLVEEYQVIRKEISKYTDLMTEYKATLISDVVTGKVDVRHIEVDEPEEEIIAETDFEDISLDEDAGEVEESED